MKKLEKLPKLTTDKQAEAWLAKADLTNYDLSGFVPAADFWNRVEAQRKDTSISLRMSKDLLALAQAKAKKLKMPTQRFMRLAIEKAAQGG